MMTDIQYSQIKMSVMQIQENTDFENYPDLK